jgi:hypothetical protein
VHRGVLAHREVVEDQHQRFGVFADALAPGAVGVAAGEIGEHPGAFDEANVAASAGYLVSEGLCHMGFAYSDSAGDRLQQLRAMLPCDITVIDEGHPLLRERLRALSFRRRQGALRLVVVLPDGTPGMVAADATDVFGDAGTSASRLPTILSVDGVRRLRSRLARDAEAASPSSVSQ